MKEPFAQRPAKANTLKAETDKLVNVRSCETPESKADDHGMAALRKKRKRGGKVDGEESRHHMGRRARGGAAKGKTQVNIIIGGDKGQQPMPAAMPPPAMPPQMMPRPPMAPPPQMMGAPGAPGPMGAQPLPGAMPPMGARKDGGAVRYPIRDGAGGGEGRMQKEKAYGKNAFEKEKA